MCGIPMFCFWLLHGARGSPCTNEDEDNKEGNEEAAQATKQRRTVEIVRAAHDKERQMRRSSFLDKGFRKGLSTSFCPAYLTRTSHYGVVSDVLLARHSHSIDDNILARLLLLGDLRHDPQNRAARARHRAFCCAAHLPPWRPRAHSHEVIDPVTHE